MSMFLSESFSSLSAPKESIAIVSVVTCLIYHLFQTIRPRKGKLPPGPPGLPFFGNLFQLNRHVWYRFTEWQDTYGDLVYITVAGQRILILNSFKVASDLLDRRASIYSSRVKPIVAGEILTGDLLMPFLPYGERWRRMRRAAHEGLSISASKHFFLSQEKEACLMVDSVLRENLDWESEIARSSLSMSGSWVYDMPTIKSRHDPHIKYSGDFLSRIFHTAFPGAHLVEFFPWMKYFPSWMAKWKRDAEYHFKKDDIYYRGMYQAVEKRLDAGDERVSFTSILQEDAKHTSITYPEKVWLAAIIFNAGGETSATAISWFMLAMVLYPEVQKRAQAQLDTVVGRDRMPTFSDRGNLPYIVALCRETLRWRTLSPVAVPHLLTEDDYYEGYYIPKGTICIANCWAMNRDPKIFGDDFDDFRPERFLDGSGQLIPCDPDTQQEGHATYGFGRRICVGRHVANNTLYIDIASLIWASWIENAPGAPGPDKDTLLDGGLVVRPAPFPCKISPRFPEVSDVLIRTKELTENY